MGKKAPGIKIIGFGNKYMSDDGIGIRTIEELEKEKDLKGAELIDGGTSGLDLIFYLQTSDKIILIDAVDAGQKTGEIKVLSAGNIEKFVTRKLSSYSLHDFDLSQVLGMAKSLGLLSRLTIIGIKPKKIDFGTALSPEIEKRMPDLLAEVKKEIFSH